MGPNPPPPPMPLPPAVVVHGAGHVATALAPGLPVLLLSAPGAACFAGAGWWRALVDGTGVPDALDCADAAGRALEAVAAGCRIVVLHPCPGFSAVAARTAPAIVIRERPPAFDLARRGAGRDLLAWLSRDSAGSAR